jgi:hypothetical protein
MPRITISTLTLTLVVSVLVAQEPLFAGPETVLVDQTATFRRYYRFGEDQISPVLLKAEGDKVLGAQVMDRIRKSTDPWLVTSKLDGFAVWRWSGYTLVAARKVGTLAAEKLPRPDPGQLDWRDYVFRRMFYDPYTAPPPPDDWTTADFDDSSWPAGRGTFQVGMPDDLPSSAFQGNMRTVHVGILQFFGAGMQSCYYRTRFQVEDPATAGNLTLSLTYRGGVRVFVNGTEIARGNLPAGNIGPEVPGEDYRLEAYNNPDLRARSLGPVKVPATALRRGVNVLAVEVRASLLHPRVLSTELSKSWNALHDREGLWRHVHLTRLQLRTDAGDLSSPLRRPAGVQVWTADIHDRVLSTDFPPAGEPAPVLRLVGARNGTFSAQVVVGTDRELPDLKADASGLTVGTGKALPASGVRVLQVLPYPADGFNDTLGDERGLGASFPDAKTLASYESMTDLSKPYIFDHLSLVRPVRVPANTSRPVWLSVDVPADAAAGTYKGTLTLSAQGMTAVTVPVELEVIPFRLPDPKNFKTYVACEQNPYAVAKQYGVKLWSDEHFRLLVPSFRQMARIGNTYVNVPVLVRSEFGNGDDSLIRWTRRRDGSFTWDYSVLDRYLDLVVRYWGEPRAVVFHVMHGHPLKNQGTAPAIRVFDEATGETVEIPAGIPNLSLEERKAIWEPFGRSLYNHLKSKGLEKSIRWGYPQDFEPDHDMVVILGKLLPDTKWIGGPHQIGNWGYTEPKYYDTFGTVRYFNNWPGFRMDMGWKAPQAHLAIPRIDSSVLSLHTASYPFAFRTFTEHALGLGRAGICRVGCDEWAAAHYDGMDIPNWIVGMPVLFTLWPGTDGAESSARFEALLEGIQEGEARIAIEQALDRSGSGSPQARAVLHNHFVETSFFQNKMCVFELEKYHYGWQNRSRALYGAAAQAARAPGR